MKQLLLLVILWTAVLMPCTHSYAECERAIPSNSTPQAAKLKINIISKRYNAGILTDVKILKKELRKLGHEVQWVDMSMESNFSYADVNLFIQSVAESFLPYAGKNYIFPNPEWYAGDTDRIASFDLVLCKTREAERIFKQYNANTVFTSFTSNDRFDPAIKKNYKKAMHLAGLSQQKGTYPTFRVWQKNAHFPLLFVIGKIVRQLNKDNSHFVFIPNFLPTDKLLYHQNQCGFHICPSETEGFGHYLMEAMSCAAVVITTDAPPMNEFVSDRRCLVKYLDTEPQNLATNYFVDESQLASVVDALIALPDSELIEIGKKNRAFYLKNDRFFKNQLSIVFPAAIHRLPTNQQQVP